MAPEPRPPDDPDPDARERRPEPEDGASGDTGRLQGDPAVEEDEFGDGI